MKIIRTFTLLILVLASMVLSGCGDEAKPKFTGSVTSIASSPSFKSLGGWSPDGKWIVYSEQFGEGSFGLCKINVQSGEIVKLLTAIEEPIGLAWSPKGDVIAFGQSGNIWTINVDDGSRAQLTYKGNLSGNIVWDNTGDSLYVHHGSPGKGWMVSEVNARTGETKEAIKKPYPVVVGIGRPRLGGGILAWAFTPKGCWLYEISLASGAINTVINPPIGFNRKDKDTWLMNPDPSPDGRFVVYMEGLNAAGGIWLVQSDGSGQQRIMSKKELNLGAGGPVWSPNYDVIAFVDFQHDPEAYKEIASRISLFRFDESTLALLRSQGEEKKQ
jgi:Tol biopolymer transport system component